MMSDLHLHWWNFQFFLVFWIQNGVCFLCLLLISFVIIMHYCGFLWDSQILCMRSRSFTCSFILFWGFCLCECSFWFCLWKIQCMPRLQFYVLQLLEKQICEKLGTRKATTDVICGLWIWGTSNPSLFFLTSCDVCLLWVYSLIESCWFFLLW